MSLGVVKTDGMAKSPKKPVGGKHVTPRVNMGIPEPWHAIMRRIAAKKRQPAIYVLIEMLAAEAPKHGITDLPSAPWEDAEES